MAEGERPYKFTSVEMKAYKAKKFIDKVDPRTPRTTAMYPVTDLKYYMDGYLRDNLDEVPKFLKKAWDCVIIVAGSGKVRIGKSTIAVQIAYYLAWLLNEERKKKGLVPPDNPVPFDNSNIAFSPDEVMKLAEEKPKHSVIVYDEGRAGLDSARAMENINKTMQDFFQECGQYGHIIIVVLPDFFKLNETIAVPRSLFLINVYTDKNYNRGYFSFFSEYRKELLYIIGKKRWGTTAKYLSVDDNFHGRFTSFFPINKEIYEENKKKALRKKRKSKLEQTWRYWLDICWHILCNRLNFSPADISSIMKEYPEVKISKLTIKTGIARIQKKVKKDILAPYAEEEEEEILKK